MGCFQNEGNLADFEGYDSWTFDFFKFCVGTQNKKYILDIIFLIIWDILRVYRLYIYGFDYIALFLCLWEA